VANSVPIPDYTPEVIIKVVSRGSNSLEAIRLHFEDLQDGKLRALETDFRCMPVVGKKAARALIEDWDLDLDALTCRIPHLARVRCEPMKLVHKIIFSMPAGTPPDKLLAAVRDFARKEYAPKHRYALALHTDEPHPHVHVVVMAINEEGARLQIRKATLRNWREAYARLLGNHAIAAKATPRAAPRKPRTMDKLRGMQRPINGPLQGTG
jgi:Relaxase/Mobilisation nuclease domain